MFLKLNHQKLDIYSISRQFVLECYRLTKKFPVEEKFAMVAQIRRAALSVHLNIAEGASRKSEVERKRFYEVAGGSVIEIDAALDIASDLGYLKEKETDNLGRFMINCFKILTGMIDSKARMTY
jgi:four helix bundle protein